MSNIAKVDQFDERKNELNEIKATFDEFSETAEAYAKIFGRVGFNNLLSNIKSNFNKLFEILYSTNENNRIKGYKDYKIKIPDAESKFTNKDDKIKYYLNFKKDLSLLNVTKIVVNEIYLKLKTFFPLIVCKEVFNSLYKLIYCENIEETEKERCNVPENYSGDFVSILLFRDLPNISDIFSKNYDEKPTFPEFYNFQYEKRFNCFVDAKAIIDLNMLLENISCETKEEIEKSEKYIKALEFIYNWAEKRNIGSKKIIEIMKCFLKILLDDLKINKISSDNFNNIEIQIEYIVKSTYGLKDLNDIIYILY